MIAVLASGSGSNFEYLAQKYPSQVKKLICNVAHAYVLERARMLNIPSVCIEHKNYLSRSDHEEQIIKVLESIKNLKCVVLAGYMRVLSAYFFKQMEKRLPEVKLINLHPAFLDDYKGPSGYEYAVTNKFPKWGITVHSVTPQLDCGPVIDNESVPLSPFETLDDFKKKCQSVEHNLLARAVGKILFTQQKTI